jgi:TolB-like protein/tetratricopeptide (TPR) repeat protein
VTKDELLTACWPNVIVTEDSLTQCISEIRRVLGVDGRALIRTVPCRGYALVLPEAPRQDTASGAATAGVAASAAAGEDATRTVAHPGDHATKSHIGRSTTSLLSTSGPTIAVLPFDNFAHDPRWNRFCDGLVEDIITDLARHPDLLVTARQSSFAFRGRQLDVRQIGCDLGVRYILEGSLQAESGHLKVTAQLIDSISGMHVWADRYNRHESDLFAIQGEVVGRVVAALVGFGGSILRAELNRARRKPPCSLQAYEMYLLGYEQEARLDRDGTLQSISLLEAAVQADPLFSRAWTVLGWAWGNAAQNGWVTDLASAHARKREAVYKAVELDPSDSLALIELAFLQHRDGNLASAYESFERAGTVGANHADTIVRLSKFVAGAFGRLNDALLLLERAFVLNPYAPPWYFLSEMRVAYFAHQFERALNATKRAPATRAQTLFKLLCLAQIGKEHDMASAKSDLQEMDRELEIIAAEAMGLCPAARDVFLNGLRKANLGGGLCETVQNRGVRQDKVI